MLFLVDGYNVTRADESTRGLLPDDQRLALMRRLGARGRALLGPGRIVVVWDKGHLAGDEDVGEVAALFALDESADDVIVRIAEAEPGPVTVVTADRELKSRVRERKGRSTTMLPCSTLFESATPTRERRKVRRDAHGGLPAGHDSITKELKDIWLGTDEDPRPGKE